MGTGNGCPADFCERCYHKGILTESSPMTDFGLYCEECQQELDKEDESE